jgi:hypothetical protein
MKNRFDEAYLQKETQQQNANIPIHIANKLN